MFYLGGVGLCFFLTVLLAAKHNRSTADKILTAWLLVMTIHLLLFYFRRNWIYPQTLGFDISFPLLHGPFLYLYTRALTGKSVTFYKALLHFVPFLIAFSFTFEFLFQSAEQKIAVYKNRGAGYETFNLLNLVAVYISGILYVILSSFELRKHRQAITEQFSNTAKINLNWLRLMIYGILGIWVAVLFTNDDWIFSVVVLFIACIGFFGIRQVGIFHSPIMPITGSEAIPNVENELISQEKRKYEKSGLSATEAEQLHQQLTGLMQREKVYTNGELSLSDLADLLATQPNYLSQVINERESTNFYDYINTLRIEEFKRLASIPENRKFTLVALAQQCGFNSKSSFNRYFKKVTGQSPSEYMQSISTPEK